jgi:hypothetical protein
MEEVNTGVADPTGQGHMLKAVMVQNRGRPTTKGFRIKKEFRRILKLVKIRLESESSLLGSHVGYKYHVLA